MKEPGVSGKKTASFLAILLSAFYWLQWEGLYQSSLKILLKELKDILAWLWA